MIGQYTEEEMFEMTSIHDTIDLKRGLILRVRGNTHNYYQRESDGSWTNYDCKTVYTYG